MRRTEHTPPGVAQLTLAAMVLLAAGACSRAPTPEEARAIAREATVYGFPMVDSYRIQYSYFQDQGNPEYKAPWNVLYNNARVYTSADRSIQTPNSDTPYSYVGADLRAEPLVITVPVVEADRYYSLQFIDMYTFNFAYVGSRATGYDAGSYLLAGPGWKGDKPAGIREVIRSETEYAFVLYRTQLFNPSDIEGVKRIQAGYKVEPLSTFLAQPAPPPAPAVVFPAPLVAGQDRTSLRFLALLDFLLRFCPTHPSETALRARFARIGVGAGKPFDSTAISPEMRAALEAGMADAWAAFDEFRKTVIEPGKRSSADVFGTRAFLGQDYMGRFAGAVLGIYGNSKEEALYPVYLVDADRHPLVGVNRYTLRFGPDQLPPVNSFWSLTLYELPSSLLHANPLNRYLINSPMLPDLKRDPDGGITLHVQAQSPGTARESNWLPAPKGPFFAVLRLYWPKEPALDGSWRAPPLQMSR